MGNMKRNMDLCRKILIEVESWPTTLESKEVKIAEYSPDEVHYNAWLLAEEDLILGLDLTGDGDDVHRYAPSCLTYKGHDFLEHARNDARWRKVTEQIASVGGAMTTKILQLALEKSMKGELSALIG